MCEEIAKRVFLSRIDNSSDSEVTIPRCAPVAEKGMKPNSSSTISCCLSAALSSLGTRCSSSACSRSLTSAAAL